MKNIALLFFVFMVISCSAPKAVETTSSSEVTSRTKQFDPAWHNPQKPVQIDSATIRVSHLVLAKDSLSSLALAIDEAVVSLHDAADDYAEKIRRNSEDQSNWNSAELIRFRRFIYSFVNQNVNYERVQVKPNEFGFYCWQEASLNKTAFDEALKETFNL